MSKEIYISSTPHETRLAIVENEALTEIYYERENEYTLAGSIYNGKVTRVLPGMQSSFVDLGLERDAFLYITDFMEEAPDSAEFETSSLGEGGSRAPRIEAGASREGQPREGQPREGQPREGQTREELPRQDRGSRGDRGRGRGRADRGDRQPNGERSPIEERQVPAELAISEGEPEFETPRMASSGAFGSSLIAEPTANAADGSELGEGAPGADGSRRWRGRRGRRRGRGPVVNDGARDESRQTTAAGNDVGSLSDSPETVEAQPFDPAQRSILEAGESRLDLDGAAEAPNSFIEHLPAPVREQSYDASRRSQAGRGDRGGDPGRDQSRGDRDRGGRGGRNDRGDRNDRSDRPARAPRGFAPSRSLYGVENAGEESGFEAPAEPIILPGESLSKYRPGGQEAAPNAAASTSPKASTEYTVAGWDGGSVLPGESLSRRRRPEGRAEARAEFRAAGPVANFVQPAPLPVERFVPVIMEEDGASVGEMPETQPEVASAAHPELIPEAETLHELSAAAEPAVATEEASTGEYEPEEGFASHRVDPIAPSEYRHTAPVEEPVYEQLSQQLYEQPNQQPEEQPAQHAPAQAAAEAAPVTGPTEAEVLESLKDRPDPYAAAETDGFGNTHFLTPAPIGPEPILSHDPVALPVSEPQSETRLQGHDVTILNPMGEMSSTPLPDEPPASASPMEEPEPTAPIHHENAVLSPAESIDALVEEADESEESATFAPGSGDLEEEVIEGDEDEVATLHAGYDDEMDDLEEETLEGAADLGTMLREMSIDQITRTAGEPEDDDLEDDFSEEQEAARPQFADAEDLDEDSEEFARTAESAGDFSNEFREPEARESSEAAGGEGGSYNERRGGRRDIRRGGRDREPRRGSDSSGRPRNTGGSGDRDHGRSGGRSRMSMQSTNLPAISELLKPGQEILVQIAKEPIAKKGARITSHIALPGRFLVFMPTVNHTGVSRKIESDGERRRLKEILLSEKGEAAGGFIVRTAASGASEEELRSDLRFLLNLWTDIKQRSESSKSPALIYHDLNLVERILRDQVTDNFSAIWVDTETEYERVLRFLQRFQPSLIRRVKLYLKETPLFEQFGITEEINKALRSKVWLKSGGSIVINQTEALVAIDINTGKFVGKTARLEDTIVKTNLDAIPEIVRQIRLRDLGGIIIIDFIDMDERKNRNRVMAALEEELKSDRAPSKVLQFNDFGLVAITRKRVKQSLERTLSTTCGVCQGTGMTKSPVTVCNDIYIEMRKMYKHLDKGDVMLRVHPEVVKQLKSTGTRWLQEMEEMSGKTILIKSDPSLHPEQFDIH